MNEIRTEQGKIMEVKKTVAWDVGRRAEQDLDTTTGSSRQFELLPLRFHRHSNSGVRGGAARCETVTHFDDWHQVVAYSCTHSPTKQRLTDTDTMGGLRAECLGDVYTGRQTRNQPGGEDWMHLAEFGHAILSCTSTQHMSLVLQAAVNCQLLRRGIEAMWI